MGASGGSIFLSGGPPMAYCCHPRRSSTVSPTLEPGVFGIIVCLSRGWAIAGVGDGLRRYRTAQLAVPSYRVPGDPSACSGVLLYRHATAKTRPGTRGRCRTATERGFLTVDRRILVD